MSRRSFGNDVAKWSLSAVSSYTKSLCVCNPMCCDGVQLLQYTRCSKRPNLILHGVYSNTAPKPARLLTPTPKLDGSVPYSSLLGKLTLPKARRWRYYSQAAIEGIRSLTRHKGVAVWGVRCFFPFSFPSHCGYHHRRPFSACEVAERVVISSAI